MTLSICGNLNIEDALYSAYLTLREWLPLDRIYIELFEAELNCLRIISKASDQGGEALDILFPLPKEAKQPTLKAKKTVEKDQSQTIYMINDSEANPVAGFIAEKLSLPRCSIVSMRLSIENEPLGAIIFIAEGAGQYTEEHADLLHMLREPFYIALSNSLRHRNITQLKNLLADDNRFLHQELHRKAGRNIIGADFGLKGVMEMVRQVAKLDSPVLLLGETGVGKDVIANSIHLYSDRKDNSFIAVNCGGIPENLVDSELFGHEKGAFTGAVSQKRGRFERADGGTIFLDEIGELPFQAQVRLLRVLQDKVIERVGGTNPKKLDIRIIAATNRNLEEMVSNGEFREDLWFRLNVFPIEIPSLRKRLFDIPALVQYFIELKSKDLKFPSIPKIADGAVDYLLNYHWPGNVRELQNIVERAMIINPKGPISFEKVFYPDGSSVKEKSSTSKETWNLEEMTALHISKALTKTQGRIHGPDGAANLLGINASTLRNKMNKLGVTYGRKQKKLEGV